MPFHGRIAYPSYVDETLFGNPHAATKARARNQPDFSNMSVMSRGELQSIALRTGPPDALVAESKRAERERLHALSNARKAKWPNTLEASRAAKERERQDKMDKEEEMRKAIDKEEEALQGEKRRLAIERANKMLYDSTDRVKALHSKLLLTDVLQERERQVELKSSLTQRQRLDEEMWYQKQQEAIRQMDAEEDAREAEDQQKREALALVRKAQIDDRKAEFSKRAEERARDAETMRSIAKADVEAELEQRQLEAEKHDRMRAEFHEANEFLLKKKAEEQAILDAEEARMQEYAAAKEKALMKRRAKETQRFVDRQTWRQKLIDEQIAKLTDLNAQQNARLEAQAIEVQAKALEARARLDEKKKDELLVTHMSRQQQMRWKAEKRAQTEADGEYYATQLKALNEQLREEEAQAIRDKFEMAREKDAFLMKQMAEKRERVLVEKADEMVQSEMSKQWMGDDDAIFEQYATLCLDEYVAAGKNPKPVQLLLQKELNPKRLTA